MAVDPAPAIPAHQVPRAARDRVGDWRRARAGVGAVITDEAYLSFRYSENIAASRGFSYNLASLLPVQDGSGVSPPMDVMVTRGLIMVFSSERIGKFICD